MEECFTASDHRKADLESWMQDYGTSLLRLSVLYLKDLHLAEDVVQETMMKAYFRYEDFKGQSSVKTWLTRIAINLCKDRRRSAWFQRVNCVDFMAENAEPERNPAGADGSDRDVEDRVEARYRNKALLKAIMSLSIKYREVILIYYYQGFSTKETAAILSVPESTVCTRLRRAKSALKKDLGGWYYDEKSD